MENPKNLPNPDEKQMSFLDHLNELRRRILTCVAYVIAGFVVAYAFSKQIFRILRGPYDNAYEAVYGVAPELININLLEGFLVYLKVGFLGGIFLASPFLFYQVWKFIVPGLKSNERKHVVPFVFLATLFFVGGALFGYFGVFPSAFKFFLEVTKGEHIQAAIRMQEYYKLASWMLIGFGLAFEGPLIVLYLVFFGVLRTRHLLRAWRGVIVGIAVASAIITPTPDIATMMMMALPLLGLYGITILVSLFFSWRNKEEKIGS